MNTPNDVSTLQAYAKGSKELQTFPQVSKQKLERYQFPRKDPWWKTYEKNTPIFK